MKRIPFLFCSCTILLGDDSGNAFLEPVPTDGRFKKATRKVLVAYQ